MAAQLSGARQTSDGVVTRFWPHSAMKFRTPLNGVLGMAGLLASTRLDDTQKAYLQALRGLRRPSA